MVKNLLGAILAIDATVGLASELLGSISGISEGDRGVCIGLDKDDKYEDFRGVVVGSCASFDTLRLLPRLPPELNRGILVFI